MSVTNAPVVSVVVPVYNGEAYLPQTVASLQAQTYPHFQLLLVDDGSTDSSLAILNDFAWKDSRLQVLQKENGGTVVKALQYALPFVTGLYFMYASQDDFFSPDLLENTIRRAVETGADAVVPDMKFFLGEKIPSRRIEGWQGNRDAVLGGREAFQLSLNWQIHGFVLWKTDLVKRVGYTGHLLNSDEYTTRLLYLYSKKVVFSQGTFFYRQNNPLSITRKWNPALPESFETCVQLEQLLKQHHFSAAAFDALYSTMLAEILRIQGILLGAQNKISASERAKAQAAIRQFYTRYRTSIQQLDKNYTSPIIKSAFFTRNFFLLQFYGKIAGLFHRFRSLHQA